MGNLEDKKQLRILVAPLDWGLGHTARCIPIIHHLQWLGHSVVVACNEEQGKFIDHALPGIEKTNLDGYGIRYSGHDFFNYFKILMQAPRIPQAVAMEHQWLRENYQRLGIEGIISDNRYGLHYGKLPAVIMTHQLRIHTGMGAMANNMVQRYHYGLLKQFGEVWVPDVPEIPRLAGELSTTPVLPKNTHYIGLLSQFEIVQKPTPGGRHLLVLLSGPEPQRTRLADKLWKQCLNYPGEVIFVAGNPAKPIPADIPAHIHYLPVAAGNELAYLIAYAHTVVCRSGYSTLMDLAWFGKPALLVPTPGQTEQDYLARHCAAGKWFTTTNQKQVTLPVKTGKIANERPPFPFKSEHFRRYKRYLEIWLAKI
ncbi:MAG: glycosyl transferase family 28 [Chitinophagia bacterium]|nr:glycosyl transferase family 28 [Chitinophagia bacterium]